MIKQFLFVLSNKFICSDISFILSLVLSYGSTYTCQLVQKKHCSNTTCHHFWDIDAGFGSNSILPFLKRPLRKLQCYFNHFHHIRDWNYSWDVGFNSSRIFWIILIYSCISSQTEFRIIWMLYKVIMLPKTSSKDHSLSVIHITQIYIIYIIYYIYIMKRSLAESCTVAIL